MKLEWDEKESCSEAGTPLDDEIKKEYQFDYRNARPNRFATPEHIDGKKPREGPDRSGASSRQMERMRSRPAECPAGNRNAAAAFTPSLRRLPAAAGDLQVLL